MVALVGSQLGMEIFPKVNAGEFQLRLRGPDGTRIEVTEELASQATRIIQDETRAETGADQVAISVGYYGLHPTSYTINNMYLWTRGPEEAVLRVGLKKGCGLDIDRLKERLRESLPRRWGIGIADGSAGKAFPRRPSPSDCEGCVSPLNRPTSSIRS